MVIIPIPRKHNLILDKNEGKRSMRSVMKCFEELTVVYMNAGRYVLRGKS